MTSAQPGRDTGRHSIRSELNLDEFAAADVAVVANDTVARITNGTVTVEVRRDGHAFEFAVERRRGSNVKRRVTRGISAEAVGAVIDAALNCPARDDDEPTAAARI